MITLKDLQSYIKKEKTIYRIAKDKKMTWDRTVRSLLAVAVKELRK